jgi:glycosyltransferase involved in cell wall biosynthesis
VIGRTRADGRIPICYLAPWLDYGGSDKGTIDWFRWLDRDRFAPLLVTTQPSDNRRLHEVRPYAEEIWPLPDFLGGQHFPGFIFDLLHSRKIRVLHIMNSRLGYELLPDLACLPDPPVVVVQLHVEEPDRSGYVRYVTTRYGNVVDAFSVSSMHLARAVEGYDVSASKIHVIPTGVDAEDEFSPANTSPLETVDSGCFNILFPGRLVAQKDPLLMVEVIRRVVQAHEAVHVHVVGDGPLAPEVRARVREAGMDSRFTFHPPSRDLARWYASCDLLLMTSTFEGVPYVIYEAMAMELAIVAPALPGNVELMGEGTGVLVDPRDDVLAYASAIGGLIEDRASTGQLGLTGRTRVRQHFSLRNMADTHARLYEDLLDARAATVDARAAIVGATDPSSDTSSDREHAQPPASIASVARSIRPSRGKPLVSTVVPCFNHGRYLTQCVDAILDQDYGEVEVIVVDDASTDPSTLRTLEDIGSRDRVRVIRQPENLGPSAARNRAIAHARGRFVLPVDSDNILLPGAIASLVEQLQAASEQVHYIYPNCQYFGTRDDYFQPPSFNLALLLAGNYCDTCSLIDRALFDAGFRYAEDILLGHEDWDFVLGLAACGIRGEPAQSATLLYRKHGFTRSDAVEHAKTSFREEITGRHRELYGRESDDGRFGRWQGPAARIKVAQAPSLSICMTEPIDFSTELGAQLLGRLGAQSCLDFELVCECQSVPAGASPWTIRRLPPGLCVSELDRLRESMRLVRASRILLGGAELTEMLAEVSFVEMLQRTFWASPSLEAIAFTDAQEHGRYLFRPLADDDIHRPAHALAWRVEAQEKLPDSILLTDRFAAEAIARSMSVNGVELQWRHAAGLSPEADATKVGAGASVGGWLDLAQREGSFDPHRRAERKMTAALGPALPALPHDAVRRWQGEISWIPPGTELLTRHREQDGQRRIVKQGRDSPPGFVLERYLGAVQRFSPPGTVRLVQDERGVRTLERGSPRSEGEDELGHLELAPLPLFKAVERVVLPDGSESLAVGEDDGIRSLATRLDFLGYIEAFPVEPAAAPDARRPHHGIVGLLRCVDWTRRRHTYHVGSPGEDEIVGELGGLHVTAEPRSIAVWIDERGGIVTGRFSPEPVRPDVRRLLRWVAAPAGWTDFGRLRGRTRSMMRRGAQAAARSWVWFGAPNGAQEAPWMQTMRQGPVGYLYADDAPGRRELFAAIHPVTGDQLLTHSALEAADMGYGPAVSLGFALARAPVTQSLSMRRVSIPWASRFGLEVRAR